MENYNTNLNVNYNTIDDSELSDFHYKNQLLNAFKMSDNDEFDVITQRVTELYNCIKDKLNKNSHIVTLLQKSASRILSEDLEMGFMLLFSYDTFYIMHKLILQLLHDEIDINILQEFNNKI